MAVPFSPETIGRHERGDVQMTPEDAVLYSERYGCQSLLLQYCADCPVGKMTGKAATERPLPFATLRVRRMLKEALQVADTLEEIAYDGVIDETEREDFAKALDFLRELENTITDMLLVGGAIKEAAPSPGKGRRRPGKITIPTVPYQHTAVKRFERRNNRDLCENRAGRPRKVEVRVRYRGGPEDPHPSHHRGYPRHLQGYG